MLLEQMIDKREDLVLIEEYIEKAMTAGVKISNHGDDIHFKQKVDSFKEVIEEYVKHQNELQEEEFNTTTTNLKLDATIGISKTKKSYSLTKKVNSIANNFSPRLVGINRNNLNEGKSPKSKIPTRRSSRLAKERENSSSPTMQKKSIQLDTKGHTILLS